MRYFYVIAVGSNMGEREATIELAMTQLASHGLELLACGGWYKNRAVGAATLEFINTALLVTSGLGPLAMLRVILSVELALGRNRLGPPGDRSIDLDLIVGWDIHAADSSLIVELPPTLQLPHPRARDRDFVMLPLADVCPNRSFSGESICFAEIAGTLRSDAMVRIREPHYYQVPEVVDEMFRYRSTY